PHIRSRAAKSPGFPTAPFARPKPAVMVGLSTFDYLLNLASQVAAEDLDAYLLTGNTANFAAGRRAYLLGARGPTLVVDTACSSSLTALPLACQSLRCGESGIAPARRPHPNVSPS